MSSGAVAASDPGGGEPKLVAGADVDMTEADGVVAEPAAEVKAEGKAAVATEAGPEEGNMVAAALSDPLYATEPTGMPGVEGPGDSPVKGVVEVNGGEKGRLEAGAGSLQNEMDGKPVPVGDVTAATGQELEAATSKHVEAEPNKLEENHINTEHGTDNNEIDYGVANTDKEIQNNVPGEVEGTSKIHEDDGAPVVDQPDDGSLMLPQTGEQFPDIGNGPSSSEMAAGLGNIVQGARYCLPPLDKGSFQVADLVWGKVKSHPWWPGEIFDPSDASELALKHQKKGSHLVAYFGDNTFAWCDESQLKPFVTNYSQMEKQSSSDAFVGSVNNALEELSRRILSGMSCSCLPEELADNGMSYTVDNAGLKDGVTCSAVNRPEILNCFSPENLLRFIKELALFPGQGGDLLELVIACSQLTSFYRSKGCPELASFQTGDAWVEDGPDGMDTPANQNVIVEEVVINEVQPAQPTQPTQDKPPKRGRGRPRKQKPVDDQVVMERRDLSNRANVNSHDEKQMLMDFDDFDNLQSKKKRNFDSFEDPEKASAPTGGSSFKIGECIRRAASQLTGSSSIVKAQNEPTGYKNAAEAENGEFDISSDDAADELTVEKRAKRRRLHRNHTADPKELLSQLCMVATEPMNGYSFSAMIISYFNDYRNYIVSTTTEANILEKVPSRRGRKRKEVVPSPEVETTDHMQDSYWSGLSLHNHPIHDLRKDSPNTRPRRRRRSSRHAYQPLSELGDSVPKKQIQVIERSIIHVDEKMVDELKPTALVLSFGRSASIPSELDLVKMYSRYGPLKETETDVDRGTNTVKVVFKKRADAERAFSVAGKYGTFGPSLRSFRLVNMPFSLKTSSVNDPVKLPEDHGVEIPGSSNCEAPKDAMEVDLVQKTEKVEAALEPSVKQVETVKQSSQVEAANTALASQVDTAPGITKSEAVTGVSLGGMIDEIQLGDAAPEAQTLHSDATIKEPTQDVSDNMQMDVAAEAPKQTHISGDITVSEAIIEAPGTVQANTEVDTANEVQEECMVSPELQSQTSGGKLVKQGATVQNVGSEGSKLEAETFGAEPVVQGAVEQVEVESKTTVEVSGAQVYSIEQSVQLEAITKASGEQLEVRRQTPEVESMADAINEHSTVMVEGTVDAKAVMAEENIENNASADVADVTAEGETNEAPDEKGKTENKAAADTLAAETREAEITAEAPDEKAENKATAEPISLETAEATAESVEQARTSEEMVEDVKALDDKTMPVEKPVEDATVVAQDERNNTVEKTVEDSKLEKSHDKTTTAETTMEDDVADRKTSEAEKPVVGATLKATDEKDAAAEKTIGSTTVKAQDVQAGARK